MKVLLISLVVLLTWGCANPKAILMRSDQTYVMETEGKPLFSLNVPDDGKWYLSTPSTMKWGAININGKPVNSYVGYALRFRIITTDNQDFLESITPVLETRNYEKFLQDSLDWYTPERLAEQKKSNPGGMVIDIHGLRCKNFWVSEHVGPNINNPRHGGQGVSVHSSFIICPLVIDGIISQLNVSIRGSISDQLDLEKEAYGQGKKLENSEFVVDSDALMKNLGKNVAAMFDTLKIYGDVSQDYKDVKIKCHPTLGDKCN